MSKRTLESHLAQKRVSRLADIVAEKYNVTIEQAIRVEEAATPLIVRNIEAQVADSDEEIDGYLYGALDMAYLILIERLSDHTDREVERLKSWLSLIEGGDAPCTDEAQLRQWAYEAVTLGKPAP